jgi:CheY-like chemotaxis protein
VVLVVDDDLDVRDALSSLLEEAGYETVSVRDGRMALDYLHAHPAPDAILLDMVMPAMSGFELWAALKSEAKQSTAPIIVVSADRFVSRRWLDSGVTAFITKPVDSSELLAAVERAIQGSREMPITDRAQRSRQVEAT